MKIWKLDAEVDLFDNLKPVEMWSFDMTRSFDGRKKSATWEPIVVERMEPWKKLRLSDTPWLNTPIPVFSDRVKKAVEDLLGDAVEFLPIICDEGEFWIVNVTNVLSCIDYEKSKFLRFKSSGRIMVFEKYSFLKDKVENENMFKIVDAPLMYPFVSDRFKEIIELNGFEGFQFKLIWDSEAE